MAEQPLTEYSGEPERDTGGGDGPSFGFARRHGVLLRERTDSGARIACRPGVPVSVIAELRRSLGVPLTIERLDEEAFERLLQQAYETRTGETMQAMEDLGDEVDLSRLAESIPEPEDLLESEDDAPIIRLINALLTEAIREGASDVHIEPFESRLTVRFRIDGMLREVLQPPRRMAPLLVSRIKVMARLDIAEKRVPQDGRISLRIAGRAVDVRVSTLPGGHGERVVLRLLDKQAGRLDLEQLGMDGALRDEVDALIHRPHGILLVTGPTGSGKTTTLYAAISRLNDRSRNILTVEDPIEYYLDGIGQTQVNLRVDMSFARGLRAILRQDPDVVMVGEIRDLETAEIAVQASLTGHMVLSTLHTNTAIGAVTRLRDMGVEPFLLSSSLVGVLAQRLVRRLCPACRSAYTAGPAECASLGVDASRPPTLYRAVGCAQCNQLGYRGRAGLFELVIVDETLRTQIHDGAGEQAMEAHARQRTPSLRSDGLHRVLAGETTLEEVVRVTTEG
ncbi:type II secretion system ATPase GspE [Arhodomonas sp. SL1]|uniref:type II secretion system ATPase GspE n=1 Tax=Arhodomonas sp. SL1 TaxID=3425691 RepID=UPI003F881570